MHCSRPVIVGLIRRQLPSQIFILAIQMMKNTTRRLCFSYVAPKRDRRFGIKPMLLNHRSKLRRSASAAKRRYPFRCVRADRRPRRSTAGDRSFGDAVGQGLGMGLGWYHASVSSRMAINWNARFVGSSIPNARSMKGWAIWSKAIIGTFRAKVGPSAASMILRS